MHIQIRPFFIPLFAIAIVVGLPPASAYGTNTGLLSRIASPRRWMGLAPTPLRATNGDDGSSVNADGGENSAASIPPRGGGGSKSFSSDVNPFEAAVRQVTGNKDYKFGDITKTVVSSTSHVFEDSVRGMTGRDDYRFGDFTKGTVNRVKNTSGNILTYSEYTLSLMREANVHELVELMGHFWSKNMNYDERKEAFVVLVYLGAILVLAYSFVANAMGGMVFAASWTRVASALGKSPLSPGAWDDLLRTKANMDMLFGGPMLPARVAATIPWFFQYRKLVVTLASASPTLREKYPVVNRITSLLVSWIFGNLVLVGAMTFGMIFAGSLMNGVPIFPPP